MRGIPRPVIHNCRNRGSICDSRIDFIECGSYSDAGVFGTCGKLRTQANLPTDVPMFLLDPSGLEAFKASALMEDATGKALGLPLDAIDFDPKQPRRQVLETRAVGKCE